MNLKERIWKEVIKHKQSFYQRKLDQTDIIALREETNWTVIDIAILETLKEVEAIGFEFTNDKDLLGISKKELEKLKRRHVKA